MCGAVRMLPNCLRVSNGNGKWHHGSLLGLASPGTWEPNDVILQIANDFRTVAGKERYVGAN